MIYQLFIALSSVWCGPSCFIVFIAFYGSYSTMWVPRPDIVITFGTGLPDGGKSLRICLGQSFSLSYTNVTDKQTDR